MPSTCFSDNKSFATDLISDAVEAPTRPNISRTSDIEELSLKASLAELMTVVHVRLDKYDSARQVMAGFGSR